MGHPYVEVLLYRTGGGDDWKLLYPQQETGLGLRGIIGNLRLPGSCQWCLACQVVDWMGGQGHSPTV